MRRVRFLRRKAIVFAVFLQCVASTEVASADCADHPSAVILEQTAASLLHQLERTNQADDLGRDSLYVFGLNEQFAKPDPTENAPGADEIVIRLEQIAERARSGDLAAARALAADPQLDAALSRLKSFVADGCATSKEEVRPEEPRFSHGRAEAPDAVNLPEFDSFSDPVKYAFIIAAAIFLITVIRIFRYCYGLVYSLIFQRYNCFVPATVESLDGECRSFGRVIIIGRKGVRFAPNALRSIEFLDQKSFGAPARVVIAGRAYQVSLFGYNGETAGFLFEKPIGMQILSAILASSKVRPTRCPEARSSLAAARRLMEKRLRPEIERLKPDGENA